MTLKLVYGLEAEAVGVALVGEGPEMSCGTRVMGLAKIDDAVSARALCRCQIS
jgi:hypothetical protein